MRNNDSMTPLNNPDDYAGIHYIVDFWELNFLQDLDIVKQSLIDAANISGALLLHTHLHRFANGGITGVALLAESHISVHTWPEDDYAAFDVFMCGQAKPQKAIELLKNVFRPKIVEINELYRGKKRQVLRDIEL